MNDSLNHNTTTVLRPFFRDHPGWAPLHLDQPVPTSTILHFLQARCPSYHPTNSVKALKA